MTSDHPPTPASTPPPGTAGGAPPRCAGLTGAYLRLVEALRASVADGDAAEEDRLRNRAQVVLGRMRALSRPTPDPTELEP